MFALKKVIENNISGKKVFLFFVLANVVYVFMLTVTIPNVMGFSHEMKLLDMMPTGYDLDYINSLFTALGNEGREAYLFHQIPVDMIYPGLFGLSYCLVIAYFLKKLHRLKGPFFFLCLLPIFAGLFDYMENFGTMFMLSNFPNVSVFQANMNSLFTILKSVTTSLSFLALIVLLIILGVKSIMQKKGRRA